MLSELRHERGISQKKAAKDLQISQALLSHYENGVREPKFEFVHKACVYYGVSADYILGRQDTDAITVTCKSPYTMDMVNKLSELAELVDSMDELVQAAAAEYLKSILNGLKSAAAEPNHPACYEDTARQMQLLSEVYSALRENKK